MQTRSFKDLALVILIAVVPMIVIGATLFPPSVDEPPPPFYQAQVPPGTRNALMLGTYAIFVLAPMIAIRWSGRPLADFGVRAPVRADLTWGLIGFLLNYVSGWLIWLAFWATDFPLGRESIAAFHYIHASSFADMVSTWPWYALVIFAEEQMARCYLITRFIDLTGRPWLAILLSSTLFGGWHMFWGAAGVLHVFKAGVIFGWLFVFRGGVMPVAVAHFVYDALTLLPR